MLAWEMREAINTVSQREQKDVPPVEQFMCRVFLIPLRNNICFFACPFPISWRLYLRSSGVNRHGCLVKRAEVKRLNRKKWTWENKWIQNSILKIPRDYYLLFYFYVYLFVEKKVTRIIEPCRRGHRKKDKLLAPEKSSSTTALPPTRSTWRQ